MSRVGRNTAIYGGSFNPFHRGHGAMVRWALARPDIADVWVMPCNAHPLQKPLAPFGLRMAMAAAGLAAEGVDLARAHVSDAELHLPEPNYTYLTLGWLRERHPQRRFTLLAGPDLAGERHKWFKYGAIAAEFGIIEVPEVTVETAPGRYEAPRATSIRERVANGGAWEPLCYPEVAAIIRRHGLYRTA